MQQPLSRPPSTASPWRFYLRHGSRNSSASYAKRGTTQKTKAKNKRLRAHNLGRSPGRSRKTLLDLEPKSQEQALQLQQRRRKRRLCKIWYFSRMEDDP